MSKLEDKLTASIKPKRPAAAKPQQKSSPPKKPVVSDADLNAPDMPIHPSRIWPD